MGATLHSAVLFRRCRSDYLSQLIMMAFLVHISNVPEQTKKTPRTLAETQNCVQNESFNFSFVFGVHVYTTAVHLLWH